MRAGHRTENQDQHRQDRAGRQGIAKESERTVTARKLHRHDARADDSREQECAAEEFRGGTSREVGAHASAFALAPAIRPISRSLRFNVMESSEAIGNAANA